MHPVKPPKHNRCQEGRMLPTASLQVQQKIARSHTVSYSQMKHKRVKHHKNKSKSPSL
jgi:hypothetical protein